MFIANPENNCKHNSFRDYIKIISLRINFLKIKNTINVPFQSKVLRQLLMLRKSSIHHRSHYYNVFANIKENIIIPKMILHMSNMLNRVKYLFPYFNIYLISIVKKYIQNNKILRP